MKFPTAKEAKLNADHEFNSLIIEVTRNGKTFRVNEDGKPEDVVYRVKNKEQRAAVLQSLKSMYYGLGTVEMRTLSDYTHERKNMLKFPR